MSLPEQNAELAFKSMPDAARVLRAATETILQRWNQAVEATVPDAEALSTRQVRNSIPRVLEKIAEALESTGPLAVAMLEEVSSGHGVARFQENYNVEEVVVEYRLLRRVILEEVAGGLGRSLSLDETLAVDGAVDIALQLGIVTFAEFHDRQMRAAADAESKYLAFLSHDLRNNLNGVMLMMEVLTRRLQGVSGFEEESEDLASLRRSMVDTVEGMDRLLQSERLRKQAVQLALGPVNVFYLAQAMLAGLGEDAGRKNLVLENKVPPGVSVFSDRELLKLVLQNLLGNAIKYSTSGVVRVYTNDTKEGIELCVSDQGPGIAPARLAKLFDAFSRGDTHGQPGMGLGLNIASHAARLLGSELKVESKVGVGSTFSLLLSPDEKK